MGIFEIYLLAEALLGLGIVIFIFKCDNKAKKQAEKEYGTCTECWHENVSLYEYKGKLRCWDCDEKAMDNDRGDK